MSEEWDSARALLFRVMWLFSEGMSAAPAPVLHTIFSYTCPSLYFGEMTVHKWAVQQILQISLPFCEPPQFRSVQNLS